MRAVRALLFRLTGLWDKGRKDREMAEELESHLAMQIEENRRSGMTPEHARRAALLKSGGLEPAKEACRDRRGLPVLEMMIRDLTFALRQARRSPGFTAVAVIAMALGIGANTAIFSVIDRVLLRPLPYKDADRLVALVRKFPNGTSREASIPKFNVWKTATSLEYVSAYDFAGAGMNLCSDGLPELVKAIHVSEDYFRLFGVSPIVGRTFTHEEDSPHGPNLAVMSHGLWTRRFGGDRGLPGQNILLNGEPYTVIGIMGPDFEGEPKADVFLPLQPDPNSTNQGQNLLVGGRMKPGVTMEQVSAETKLVGEKFRRMYPRSMPPAENVGALSMRELAVHKVRATLLILLGAVTFVLLIACTNVANLLLARSAGRSKEIAVRVAIGAGRGHIFRQLLTESVLLSLLGGLIGVFLGAIGLRVLLSLEPGDLPRMPETEHMSALALLDGRILLFALGVSVLTGLLFGLVPALQISRPDLGQVLREGGARTTGGARRQMTLGGLAVAEIALSLVLLIGAALMMRTFVVVRSVKPGFDAAHALTMKTSLAGAQYSTAPKMETLIRNMQEHFESLPGVQAAAYAFNLPVEGGPDMPFSIIGHAPPHGEPYQGSEQYRLVSAHYFRALGVPLRRGRLFNDADSNRGAPVVILNEAFAKKYWPKEDPLGLSISIGHGMGREFEDKPRLIVGIVGNVRENGLDQDLPPVYYVPEEQAPDGMIARSNRMFPSTWIVRTSGSPSALAGSVEREMLRVDPQLPVSEIYSMAQIVSKSTARQNFNMLLLGIFAGVALLLAAAGIYGVMAYSVDQRTHEIGVRMALGANRREVLGLVLKRGMTLALAGLAVGMVAAFGLTRLLKSMLFGIAPHDPGTFVAVPVLLTLVSALVCAIPARRAAKVDPMVALRHE